MQFLVRNVSRTLEELEVRPFTLVNATLEEEFEQQDEGMILILT